MPVLQRLSKTDVDAMMVVAATMTSGQGDVLSLVQEGKGFADIAKRLQTAEGHVAATARKVATMLTEARVPIIDSWSPEFVKLYRIYDVDPAPTNGQAAAGDPPIDVETELRKRTVADALRDLAVRLIDMLCDNVQDADITKIERVLGLLEKQGG